MVQDDIVSRQAVNSLPSAAPGGGEELTLRLSIEPPGTHRDVVLQCDRSAPTGDAISAILEASRGGDHPKEPVIAYSRRQGRLLLARRPIGDQGLRQGDVIEIRGRSERPEGGAAEGIADFRTDIELAIMGGPEAGRRIPLMEGTYVVGRDAAAQIVLADPTLSGRHLRVVVGADLLTIEDLGSTNGTFVDSVRVPPGSSLPMRAGQVIELGRTTFSLEGVTATQASLRFGSDGLAEFRRPPRIRRPFEAPTLEVPAPPVEPGRPKVPIVAAIVPVVVGLALAALFQQPLMLVFAVMSPVIAAVSRYETRRSGAGRFQESTSEFRAALAETRRAATAALAEEELARRADAPDASVVVRRALGAADDLWVRRPADGDFLDVRLGSGDQPARTTIQVRDGGSPSLRAEAEAVKEAFSTTHSVPAVVSLRGAGSIALTGPQDRVAGMARWLLVQSAVLQSPRDLRFCLALSVASVAEWDWAKWLPHMQPDPAAGSPGPVVVGEEATERLIQELLNRRDPGKRPGDAVARPLAPFVTVVIDGRLRISRPRVERLIAEARAMSVGIVWLGGEARDLPDGFSILAALDSGAARLELSELESGTTHTDLTADSLTTDIALQVARALAPLRDAATASGAQGIPRRISLLEIAGLEVATEDGLVERWREPALGVVVGAVSDGPFIIDLDRDGPHALVGGTTGSGKSELLQTLIASLAIANPPSRLTFLLVDYKGGAAFRDCVSLPHTVGFVTDLDEHLARRALTSLDAEIRRREGVLAAHGAKNLDALVERGSSDAPPRLIIVVDEFATLTRDVPAFVDGIVNIAQRGRTLGVHLVLATQRPTGVVTRDIWANTNLRIALRVTDASDSTDVIGLPDAAGIPGDRPGRAFARVGQAMPVEFQAAFVGGHSFAEFARVTVARPFTLATQSLGHSVPEDPGAVRTLGLAQTDLQTIVTAAAAASARLAIPTPVAPWLPPLPPVIPLATAEELLNLGARDVAIAGLTDEPSIQRQSALAIDLESDGSVLVYGGGASGKTTVLRTLAASLAGRISAEDLWVYGLDFGAGGLRAIEALPHCGAVIPGSDEDRVARLLGFMRDELADRQRRFSELGRFTVSEFRAGLPVGEHLPRLVLLLDGYGAFASAYERVQFGEMIELVTRLATDGRSVGIHLFISAERRGAVPSRLAGVIGRRLILRQSDEGDYAQLGLGRDAYLGREFPAGRGLTEGGIEFQAAIAGEDPSPAGQVAALAAIGEQARLGHPEASARRIRLLPTEVAAESMPIPSGHGRAVLGLTDRTLQPVEINLADAGFVVAGPLRSGRSTALVGIARSLRQGNPDVWLDVIAPRRSPLTGAPGWTSLAEGADASAKAIAKLASDLTNPQVVAASPPTADVRRVVLLDDAEEFLDGPVASDLTSVIRLGRDRGIRVVAAIELRSALRAFSPWLLELRKDRQGLLLQPGQEMAGDLLGVTLPRPGARPLPPGRGYLVASGSPELVQVTRIAP